MDQDSTIPVPVWFMCKFCSSVFPSVEKYWGHKVEKHSTKFLRNRAIIFEESILELAETETNADADSKAVIEPTFKKDGEDFNKFEGIDINTVVEVKMKEEEAEFSPVFPIAIISDSTTVKTTSEYETHHQEQEEEEDPAYSTNLVVFMPQPSEDYNINFYDETEASPGSDEQADVDLCQDPLENGPPSHELPPAFETSLPDHEFYNENENEGGVDIICLDDSDADDDADADADADGDTASASKTANVVNNFIQIQPKLQCKFCSKQHTSEAELRVHVTICQLSYINRSRTTRNRNRNRNRNGRTNNPPPAPETSSVNCEYILVDGDGDGSNMMKCHICCRLIKDCNLKRHLRTHNIFVKDQNRKFSCQICGAAFKTNALVRRHLRVHSDDRPFTCPFPSCHSTFKYQRNLRHHVKTLHADR